MSENINPEQTPEQSGVPAGYDQPAPGAPTPGYQAPSYQAPAAPEAPSYQQADATKAPSFPQPNAQGYPDQNVQQGYQQPGTQQGYQQGYQQPAYAVPYGAEQKSKVVAGILGILLGAWGIHRFYLGHTKIGVIQIIVTFFTFGIGSLWGFIEGIMILVGADPFKVDARGIPLKD